MKRIKVNKQELNENLYPYYKAAEKMNLALGALFSVDVSDMETEDKRKYFITVITDYVHHRLVERTLYFKLRKLYDLPEEFRLDYDTISYK